MISHSQSDFASAVRRVVAAIPRGTTLSYASVAKCAGFPGAARAVGSLMRKNRDSNIPCHRVVRSDGRVGEYAFGGSAAKEQRLKREGVRFAPNGRVFSR